MRIETRVIILPKERPPSKTITKRRPKKKEKEAELILEGGFSVETAKETKK